MAYSFNDELQKTKKRSNDNEKEDNDQEEHDEDDEDNEDDEDDEEEEEEQDVITMVPMADMLNHSLVSRLIFYFCGIWFLSKSCYLKNRQLRVFSG